MSEATFLAMDKFPGYLRVYLPTFFAVLPIFLTTHLINFFGYFFSEFCILGDVSVMLGSYYVVLLLAFLIVYALAFAPNFFLFRNMAPRQLISNYVLNLALFAAWNVGTKRYYYIDQLSACLFD